MTAKSAEQLVQDASAWWTTEIIDVEPGEIRIRGYPIENLIGKLSFPSMIWLMLRGEIPGSAEAQLFEAALVSAVDHGPQAPSIAIARMAMTCGVRLNSAMASAINVLDGTHGGAGQQCMELYQDIFAQSSGGTALEAAIDAALDRYVARNGKIIAGYGHRWHPIDPRATKLLQLVDAAARAGVVSGKFGHIGREVERVLGRRTEKRLPMNIDGATAVIFSELGFEPELGRGLFILSRSVGILAHAWEERKQKGRMKGPMPKSIPYTYSGPAKRQPDFGDRDR